MIEINDIVAPNIEAIIIRKGLKQNAVAQKAGYTKQQFNAMLRDRKVIRDIDIVKIASVLEVDANTLLRERKEV